MSASKKKKSTGSTAKKAGAASAKKSADSAGKKSSGRGKSSRASTATQSTETSGEETFVKKYYPIFENLVLFFLGMGTYWEAMREYLRTEVRYRTGQAFQGFAFFVVAVTFLTGSVFFFMLAIFFTLQWLTGSSAGASFALFIIALGLAGLFFYLTFGRFQNVIEPRYDESKDDFDDF